MEGKASYVQTALGTGHEAAGMVAFHITYGSLLGAEVQTGREGHEAQSPPFLHYR